MGYLPIERVVVKRVVEISSQAKTEYFELLLLGLIGRDLRIISNNRASLARFWYYQVQAEKVDAWRD